MTKQPLPFKGSLNNWVTTNDRVIPVGKLSNPHLLNIMQSLKDIAVKNLEERHVLINSFEINNWLIEYCITFPRLKNECRYRGLWVANWAVEPEKKEKPIKQLTLADVNKRIDILEDRFNIHISIGQK